MPVPVYEPRVTPEPEKQDEGKREGKKEEIKQEEKKEESPAKKLVQPGKEFLIIGALLNDQKQQISSMIAGHVALWVRPLASSSINCIIISWLWDSSLACVTFETSQIERL